QVAHARVITKARPVLEHAIEIRVGERGQCREAAHEALVVRDDGAGLRLLQHDLGHPGGIRAALALPRKIVATVDVVPLEQRRCDLAHREACVASPLASPLAAPSAAAVDSASGSASTPFAQLLRRSSSSGSSTMARPAPGG